VVAAAVILPPDFKNELLNDSKQLNEKHRYALREIIEKEAIAYAVDFVPESKIAEINILWASILGMHNSLDKLKVKPEHVIIDGNRFKPYKKVQHQCVIMGDGKYLTIAAASILAKTYRDDLMQKLHQEFPHYGWNSNKGYPTKKHREAIREYGITPYHRKSFNLLGDTQLSLPIFD
jgi:ribonuclease HII